MGFSFLFSCFMHKQYIALVNMFIARITNRSYFLIFLRALIRMVLMDNHG